MQDHLEPLLQELQAHKLSTAERRLLNEMEIRARIGPPLTSRDVDFLKRWKERLNGHD